MATSRMRNEKCNITLI